MLCAFHIHSHSLIWAQPPSMCLSGIMSPLLQVQAIFKIASSQDLPAIPESLSPQATEFLLLCLQVRACVCI